MKRKPIARCLTAAAVLIMTGAAEVAAQDGTRAPVPPSPTPRPALITFGSNVPGEPGLGQSAEVLALHFDADRPAANDASLTYQPVRVLIRGGATTARLSKAFQIGENIKDVRIHFQTTSPELRTYYAIALKETTVASMRTSYDPAAGGLVGEFGLRFTSVSIDYTKSESAAGTKQ